jgi:hypothetical protein
MAVDPFSVELGGPAAVAVPDTAVAADPFAAEVRPSVAGAPLSTPPSETIKWLNAFHGKERYVGPTRRRTNKPIDANYAQVMALAAGQVLGENFDPSQLFNFDASGKATLKIPEGQDVIKRLQTAVGATPDGCWGPKTHEAVKKQLAAAPGVGPAVASVDPFSTEIASVKPEVVAGTTKPVTTVRDPFSTELTA